MSFIDLGIIICYLIGMVLVGLYFERKASAGIDAYFLGGRTLPWWVLGASGMASNFDVTGTMINTALFFAVGASGFFIEIRGGVTLIMAFLLAYMGKWNRRAQVMTIAEWMKFRFGERTDGHVARVIGAASQIIFTVAMVTYFAVGSGKFIAEFFGIPSVWGLSPDFVAALILITLSMVYTVASGLYGVVWTDVFQGMIVFITLITVAFISFTQYKLPEKFNVSYPLRSTEYITETITKTDWTLFAQKIKDGDSLRVSVPNPENIPLVYSFTKANWPGVADKFSDTLQISYPVNYRIREVTKSEWTSIIPKWKLDYPDGSDYSIFNLFGIAILFYMIKTFFEGSGGTGGYMIQRYFAAKNDREAGLLSAFWVFLLSFRWLFIAAVAMLGISLFNHPEMGYLNTAVDPEGILPIVINQMMPIGLKGLFVAGLMAAAMSTFDSTINAGAAYWVKDIYQAYLNPQATEKQLLWHSRISSIIIVIIGLIFSLFIRNINEIWGWITMALGSGLLIPFLARWYWARLNGWGFSGAVFCGMTAAVLQKIFFPNVPEYTAFFSVNVVTFVSMIVCTYLTSPTPDNILSNFYNITRPFGSWKKYFRQLPVDEQKALRSEHFYDILAVFLAIPWQLCLFLSWMAFIMRNWAQFSVVAVLTVIFSVALYFFWYKKLSTVS